MRAVVCLVTFALFMAGGDALPADAGDERPIALVHAAVIDGTGGPVLEDGVVVVRGRTIEAVGPAAGVAVPAGARIIDARGKAVMPGLADMHVHLVGGWDGESPDLLGYRRYLNALLYSGVTTVLDTGNVKPFVLQLKQEVAAGRLAGPRIYCAGPLLDGPDPLWPPISQSITSVEQVPKIVRSLKEDGVDVVKAYVGLSVPMVWAIAAEARKHALPVIVDQSWRNGMVDFAAGGITAFAHAPDFIVGEDNVALLKQRGIMFISTLAVVESKAGRRLENLAFLDDPLIRDTVPPDFVAALRAYKRGEAGREENLRRFKQQAANLKRLFDAGLVIAAGTDAAYPGVFQGEGLHRELELLVEAGLRPLDAIAAATGRAARLVAADKEWGTLAAGKLANLLIVAGRPDRAIGDTRKIESVMQLGRVIDRSTLVLDARSDPGFRPTARVSAR